MIRACFRQFRRGSFSNWHLFSIRFSIIRNNLPNFVGLQHDHL
jgi:hypothetical protein